MPSRRQNPNQSHRARGKGAGRGKAWRFLLSPASEGWQGSWSTRGFQKLGSKSELCEGGAVVSVLGEHLM